MGKWEILNKFLNDYEITNNSDDRIQSKEIEDWLKVNSSKVSMTKFGLEMKKYVTINKFDTSNIDYNLRLFG